MWPSKGYPAMLDLLWEMTIENGLLLKGTHIIVPHTLHPKMIQLLHTGHLRLEKCLNRAKQSMYWPGLYDKLKELITNCTTCLKFSSQKPTYLPNWQFTRHEITVHQWSKLASDIFYFEGDSYLLIVDYKSRFLIIRKLSSMTSKAISHHMQAIFAEYGWSNTLVTDNGPCYTSKDFQMLIESMSVNHITSSPHHPQSNGLLWNVVVVKWWLQVYNFKHYLLGNTVHTYIHLCSLSMRWHMLWDAGKSIYIYWKAKWDQLTKGSVCETKQVIIQHPPFWEYNSWQLNYNKYWLGMYTAVHYDNKVCGQSRSIVPRFPWSGILVPCRHGWIFVAAQVWHGMSQALVPGHSFEQLVWQEQLEPGSSGLPVLQVQQMWVACVVQVGAMQVVPLRSGVLSEPAAWQLCHLGKCWLLWHCIHEGVSTCSSMWNHCQCVLDSCSTVGCISQ